MCTVVYSCLDIRYRDNVRAIQQSENNNGEEEDDEDEGNPHGGKMDFGLIKDLNRTYWLCVIHMALQGQLYYGFTSFSTECLIKRYGFNLTEAKNILVIMPLSSMFCIPLYSFLAMKFGFKTPVLLIGTVIGTLCYWLMTFLGEDKPSGIYLPIILLGQLFSIHGSMVFSCIAMACTKRSVAIGFGICLGICNLNASILPYFLGKIIEKDTPDSYEDALQFMIKLGILATFFAAMLVIVDLKQGGILFYPENS